MALAATTVFETRTGGDDLNGGGFNSAAAGTDRSLQDSPHVTIDGATITLTVTASTTINTIVGYTVSAADVGNTVNLTGGTVTPGLYQITAVNTGTNTWTFDRAAGTNTQTGTGRMGGAFGSPGKTAASLTLSGQIGYIRAGTYTMTTATPGAGGPLNIVANVARVRIEGYQTTRGDLGTQPVISAGAVTTITMYQNLGNSATVTVTLVNVEFNGNGGSAVDGIVAGSNNSTYKCVVRNCNAAGTNFGFGTGVHFGGLAVANGLGFSASSELHNCAAINNTSDGISGSTIHTHCLAHGNGGDGFDSGSSTGVRFTNCTADGNTGSGFRGTGANARLNSCLATNNGGYGYEIVGAMVRCASYLNTSGRTNSAGFDVAPITLSADPYVNQAGDDFRPNTAATGGALVRGQALPVGGQSATSDAGAVQHSDPVSTSGGSFTFS